MSVILYFNGKRLDLDPKTVIAQTKQVNDLNNIETRQANYTNKFKVPKTASNIKAMEFLTLVGNESNIPYQKNECSLYSSTGECFVYKGWAIVNDAGDSFDITIYDGIIDLYKAIENKTLADLNLSQYEHDKDVNTVKYSWSGAAPYIYILADYNGDTGDTANRVVNTDYLVPAIKIEFLWQLIFFTFNIEVPTGSVFFSPEFKDIYMTYPKGVEAIDSETVIFDSNDYGYRSAIPVTTSTPGQLNKYFARYNTATVHNISDTDHIHLNADVTGLYRLEISGSLNTRFAVQNDLGSGYFDANARLYLAKNAEGQNAIQAVQFDSDLVSNVESKKPFQANRIFSLSAGDSISLVIGPVNLDPGFGQTFIISNLQNTLEVKLSKVEAGNVDFENSFADFSIRDFLTEVVHRFGLTIFKDKYTNAYEFRTLQEHLQTAQKVDWSNKFDKKISEDWLNTTYAQRNWFRYNYNDKESSYNDNYIIVNNKNLEDNRDVIKSKIYSPERDFVNYLNERTNCYKLWDKELVEATDTEPASVNYKALDKRYYFMRAKRVDDNIIVISKKLQQQTIATTYYRESFQGLSFGNIIQRYYGPLSKVLDKSIMITVDLWLTDTDIVNFDFRKQYYFEQLSNYFIVNKIINYIPGRVTRCELIRVIPS
jgi:hypothetical protein